MSNQPLSRNDRIEYNSPTVCTYGGANTKGSWVEVIAATSFEYRELKIHFSQSAGDGGGECFLWDVGVGAAGFEQVIIPNLLYDSKRSYVQSFSHLRLPIVIAAGERIAIRCQDVAGAGTRSISATLEGRAGGVNFPAPKVGKYYDYGTFPLTTNGTVVDPGATINTWGAWTELTAATSADHNVLAVLAGINQSTSNPTAARAEYQVAIGPAGSEQIISGGLFIMTGINGVPLSDVIFADIPAGSRISARSQSSTNATVNRGFTMAVYGG